MFKNEEISFLEKETDLTKCKQQKLPLLLIKDSIKGKGKNNVSPSLFLASLHGNTGTFWVFVMS